MTEKSEVTNRNKTKVTSPSETKEEAKEEPEVKVEDPKMKEQVKQKSRC